MSPADQLLVAPAMVGAVGALLALLLVRDVELRLAVALMCVAVGIVGGIGVDLALHGVQW